MIHFTDNDLLLFKYIFESHFITRDQIKEFIWEGYNNSSVDNRLWKLTKEGYLRKVKDIYAKSNRASFLVGTSKALKAIVNFTERIKNLKRNNNFELAYINPTVYTTDVNLRIDNYAHDKMLNELRFRFENHGASYWFSDILINKVNMFYWSPDGSFQKKSYDGKAKTFAVELERIQKAKYRYRDIFTRYSKDSKVNYVIYVTTSNYVYNSLYRKFNSKFINYKADSYKKFYLLKWDDIKKGKFVMKNPSVGEKDLKKEVFNNDLFGN